MSTTEAALLCRALEEWRLVLIKRKGWQWFGEYGVEIIVRHRAVYRGD